MATTLKRALLTERRWSSATGTRSGARAEVGGDDRHGAAAVRAGSRRRDHGTDTDLAPVAREDVRAVRRAVHPLPHRERRAVGVAGPEQVLADRPRAEAARWVEAFDPAPECRPVGAVVLEVTLVCHVARVVRSGGRQAAVRAKRPQPVAAVNEVDPCHDARLDERAGMVRVAKLLTRSSTCV